MRLNRAAPALTVVTAMLAGCGGGGTPGNDTGAATQTQATSQRLAATVSGAVVKGPVQGAQVCAFAVAATGKGQALGCTTSNADGSYSLSLNHDGPVLIEATGGTYTDEATGTAGVALTTPLSTLGLARPGQPVTVVTTPLTAMAVERALRRGALSQDSFEAAAEEVGTALGLPAGTLLAGRIPDVTSGTPDLHGQALRGISRMLQRGATLAGLLGNADLQKLAQGWRATVESTTQCTTTAPDSTVADITLDGKDLDSGGMSLTVESPWAGWRSLLPASGQVMGCTVTSNTATQVRMQCPATALDGGLTLVTDPSRFTLPAKLPAEGVLVMGTRISGNGAIPAQLSVVTAPTSMPGPGCGRLPVRLTASGAVLAPGDAQDLGSGGTPGTLGQPPAPGTGTTIQQGGTLVLSGSGGVTTTGTSSGSGTVTVSGNTAP